MNVITNATGYTAGPGISIVEMEILEAYRPDWPQAAASNTIEHYMFDERFPAVCHVFPPADTAAYVELVYVAKPTDCATTASTLSLGDEYANALLYFVLARAYEKDTDNPNSASRAQHYYSLFYQSLGLKADSDVKTSPNLARQDGVPPRTLG
jgi:hypothetical protein